MSETSQEILMLMRPIGEGPQLYGSERSVDGLLVGFAALAIKVERGGDLGANLNTARALAFMATRDVPRRSWWDRNSVTRR